MRYFDTSFLAPLIRPEEASRRVTEFVAGLPAGELTISRWTEIEVASLLARDVRMGILGGNEAREADTFFHDIVRRSFVVLSIQSDDCDRAQAYLHNYATGLRAGDALHLAIAGNHRADVVYSLDESMIKAGRILGLPMSRGSAQTEL